MHFTKTLSAYIDGIKSRSVIKLTLRTGKERTE